MLQEEFDSTRPPISSDLALAPDCCKTPDESEWNEAQWQAAGLADELIEKCCGSHSLALIYRFLLSAGMEEAQARAEFERFLAGKLSEKMLDIAAQWVDEERR
jgi:hypothetical protein